MPETNLEIIDVRPVVQVVDERPVIEVFNGPRNPIVISATEPLNPFEGMVWIQPVGGES